MILAKIRVSGVRATLVDALDIPMGAIGGKVSFEYTDPMWDGLTKTIVFNGAVTKDVLNAGEIVEIPPEVIARAGVTLRVGVYGTDADNSTAIPTLWADLGRVRAAADPSGDASTDPSLPVWAQLDARVKKLEDAYPTTTEISDDSTDEEVPTAAAVRKYVGQHSGGNKENGIPKGGKAGQYLRKQSDADYDVVWTDLVIPEQYGLISYDQDRTITIT